MSPSDWTGVSPEKEPVAPLSDENFVTRLRQLSARARDLVALRAAMQEQGKQGK